MWGCGGNQQHKDPPDKHKKIDKPEPPMRVNVPNASAIESNDKNEVLWKIRWKTGQIAVAPSNPKFDPMGDLKDVSGEIYDHAAVACVFSALRGNAKKDTEILTLSDHVKLIGKDPAATLTCDRLIYEAKRKLIRAIGHVHILGTTTSVGTIDELWATPDLKKIATPGMFNQP